MRFSTWLSIGSMSVLWASAGAAALEDPADPGAAPPPGEEEEAPPRALLHNELSLSYMGVGDARFMRRYARPARWGSVSNLRLLSPLSEHRPYAGLTFRGGLDVDNVAEAFVAFNDGASMLRLSREQYRYMLPDWQAKPESTEDATSLSLQHAFAPNLGGFVVADFGERAVRYPAPRDEERNRTQLVGGGVQGQALGGHVSVTASERLTTPLSGGQAKRLQRTFTAAYAPNLNERLSLEGKASWTRIEQAGLRNSGVKSYALGGAFEIGPDTTLSFDLGRQDYDLDNVARAYVRKRVSSGARIVHRWEDWSLQFGFRHKESERIRSDRSFVDVPSSNVYDFRLAGRLGDAARLSIRGSWEDGLRLARMTGTDPRQMQWDDRGTFHAQLDGGNEALTGYASYAYRFQQNRGRDIELRWHNVSLGASYVFNPEIVAFAEYSGDRVDASSPSTGGLDLAGYFTNSRSAALGLSWTRSDASEFSTSLNHYEGSEVRGTEWTLSYRRRLAENRDLELVFAPWSHDDRLYDINSYRRTILMVRYSIKF